MISPLATTQAPVGDEPGRPADYRPGECNIGPAEVARRRRAGAMGLAATILLLTGLVLLGASPAARLLLVIPATVAASGYLQAWLKFCAGFGSLGIFNFEAIGATSRVIDPDARRRDRSRANQIGVASVFIGIAVATAAVLLPL